MSALRGARACRHHALVTDGVPRAAASATTASSAVHASTAAQASALLAAATVRASVLATVHATQTRRMAFGWSPTARRAFLATAARRATSPARSAEDKCAACMAYAETGRADAIRRTAVCLARRRARSASAARPGSMAGSASSTAQGYLSRALEMVCAPKANWATAGALVAWATGVMTAASLVLEAPLRHAAGTANAPPSREPARATSSMRHPRVKLRALGLRTTSALVVGRARAGATGSGRCSCFQGYTGPSCSQECPGGVATPCSGRGICEANATCTCFSDDILGHWGGSDCSTCASEWRGVKCNQQCPRVGGRRVRWARGLQRCFAVCVRRDSVAWLLAPHWRCVRPVQGWVLRSIVPASVPWRRVQSVQRSRVVQRRRRWDRPVCVLPPRRCIVRLLGWKRL